MQKNYLLLALLFLLPHLIHAQKNGINKEKYRISIKKAIDKIEIDGKLNEQSWIQADRTNDFLNKWPTDQGKPPCGGRGLRP